jgi:hypothetical protein
LNARRLFYADAGGLRAPWRIVVFSLATLVAFLVCAVVLGPLLVQFFTLLGVRGVSIDVWIECAALLIGTAVALRYVDKRPWRDVWLDRDAARPALIGFGFVLGGLAIGIPTAMLIAGRWLRETGGGPGSWWGAAIRLTLMLVPAALAEELATRGYILSVLRGWWGWSWAIVVTSVAFGLLHLANAGATTGSLVLVTVAGLFLAAVVYATRSLYAAWAAHFAWNWTMAVLFHTAVSGLPFEAPRYRYVDAGPDWATGGVWGPEGGVPAGLGMGAGVGIAYAFARRARSRRENT